MKRLILIPVTIAAVALAVVAPTSAATGKVQSTTGGVCLPVTVTAPSDPSAPVTYTQTVCPATFTLQLQQLPYRPGVADLRATIDYDCLQVSRAELGTCAELDKTRATGTAVPLQNRPLYLYLDGQRIKTIHLSRFLSTSSGTSGNFADPMTLGFEEWYHATYDIGTLRVPKRVGWHRLQIGMFGDEPLFDGMTLEARSSAVWFWVP